MIERVLEGGIPEGSALLIAGEPGTGKTILATTIAREEVEKGKKCLYISFNEKAEDFNRNMKKIGYTFDESKFKFLFLPTVSENKFLLNVIYEKVIEEKPDIIIIDSINALTLSFPRDRVRSFIHTSLYNFVKSNRSKLILIAEKPIGEEVICHGVEEFVVDGLILLKLIPENEHVRRMMYILKMRGMKIKRPGYEFDITDRGLVFFEVPELIAVDRGWTEKIETGLSKLDEITNGGFYRGSTLAVVGETGTGKTTLCIQMCYENAKKGRNSLYISFEEGKVGLLKAMEGFGMNYDDVSERLEIVSIIPEAKSPVSTYADIQSMLEKYNSDIVVIDSLSTLRENMNARELTKIIRYLQLSAIKKSFLLVITVDEMERYINTLADSIIKLEKRFEDGKIVRELVIVKERASRHSECVWRFGITERGVELYDRS